MDIINQTKTSNIGLGSIVHFPEYGTTYIVHVADRAAIEQFACNFQDSYQLYRLDGRKPYRRVPFTAVDLEGLVRRLDGEIFNSNEFALKIVRK